MRAVKRRRYPSFDCRIHRVDLVDGPVVLMSWQQVGNEYRSRCMRTTFSDVVRLFVQEALRTRTRLVVTVRYPS